MLFRSMIESLLHKPFWNDFGGILCGFSTITQLWMKLGSIYMIQRPENIPRKAY
jgi:hypothetical protein